MCVPCLFRLTVNEGEHEISSGVHPRRTLDGLGCILPRVHPVFVPSAPGCLFLVPFRLTVDDGRHRTTSGGHPLFLGQSKRGLL